MKTNSNIPLYYQVAETLKERIIAQQYREEDLLPPESQLNEEFGVSSITIRKAMALLVEQGYITRQRGIGTQVVHQPQQRMPLFFKGRFEDWVASTEEDARSLKTQILDIRMITAPPQLAKVLLLSNEDQVWQMRRVRSLKSEHLAYHLSHIPAALLKKPDRKAFEKAAFVKEIQRQADIRILQVEQRVEVVIASVDVANILRIGFGSPLFRVLNLYKCSKDRPCASSLMYFRGDRYLYETSYKLT